MIRRVSYRSAGTAFVFAGLWFVLGLLLLWSPIPGALGIRGHMLMAWLFLFLIILAGSGAMLTLASYNGIFPPDDAPMPAAQPSAQAEPLVTPDGKPMPWTQSPLPSRPAKRVATTTTTALRSRPSEQPPASRGQ
jgi:hypothetical protein